MRTESTAATAHSAARPTARPPLACAAACRRVVCPVRRSSQRPASSSPRSSLVLVSSPQMAPSTINVMMLLKMVKPATVCRAAAGPKRAALARLDPKAAAN